MMDNKRAYLWITKDEAEAIRDMFVTKAITSDIYSEIERAVGIVKSAEEIIMEFEEKENGK